MERLSECYHARQIALIGNWTVKAEYLYVDFGKVELHRFAVEPNTGLVFPNAFVDSTANLRAHIARFGINYKFYADGPAAVR